MHLYLKYQSPNTFGSKDIAQVKVFKNQVKVQDQGHFSLRCDTDIGVMTTALRTVVPAS
jgi:hypothetical protein